MWLVIIIYLTIGTVLNFIGPVAKYISDTLGELKDQSGSYINKDGTPPNKEKILLFEIFLRLLLLFFYPLAYVVALLDYSQNLKKEFTYRKNKKIEKKQKLEDLINNKSFLYFKDTYGGGIIRCHGCCFKEEINCSTHGFSDVGDFYDGYQCQTCGKFHTITSYGNEITKIDRCPCGGKLSRDNPIFCQKCRSFDVSFQMTYVT